MSQLFQVGCLSAFLQGLYEGDYSFAKIKRKGNTGLGTVNNLQGEMIALDGKFYVMDENGQAAIIQDTECTPFALVTNFKPNIQFDVKKINHIIDLTELIRLHLTSKNLFYMLRIDGDFKEVDLRSERCLFKTLSNLDKLLPAIQNKFSLFNTEGSLVASICPSFMDKVTIADFHYHFIDKQRNKGGHVFDLQIDRATVNIQILDSIQIQMFNTEAFNRMNLDIDVAEALNKFE